MDDAPVAGGFSVQGAASARPTATRSAAARHKAAGETASTTLWSEPPPIRARYSSDHHSYCSDNDGCYSERSISLDEKDSQYSGRPRSDSSREDDNFCGSYVHSYGSCDSDYDSISTKQRVREYINYDLYASDEDSNVRKGSGKGKSLDNKDGRTKRDGKGTSSRLQAPEAPPESPPETTEDGTVPLLLVPSRPLINGFIAMLWGPRTSAQWHEQMRTSAAESIGLFYRWMLSVGLVHMTTSRWSQENITLSSTPIKKRAFYLRPPSTTGQPDAAEAEEINKQ